MSQGICKDLSFSVVQKSNVHNYSDTKNIDCFGLAVFVVDFVVSVYTCEPDMVELTWVGDSCFYLVWSNSECVIRSEVTLYADRTQKKS